MLRFRAVTNILEAFKLKAGELVATVGRISRKAAKKILHIALWRVPYYSRWGMYLQAAFILVCLIWFQYRPEWATQGPGVAMGFLAVAAIFMAVRGANSTPTEGIVWIAVSASLFAVEMHSLALERKEREGEQAELRATEESTQRKQTQSFAKLINDGQVLFRALEQERTLTEENLEHITGGAGYCWVVPLDPLPPIFGGDPAHQGNNWWQLGLKNSGKVVMPTCDIHFVPFPTKEEFRQSIVPQDLFYHFEKVPITGRRYSRYTSYFIRGDRTYSGVVETPTHTFIEVIKFEPAPNRPNLFVPKCLVSTPRSEKVLENDCNPQ